MNKFIKANGKQILIDTVVGSLVATLIVYLIAGEYNETMIELLQAIAKNDTAAKAAFVFFPIAFIIYLTINLAKALFKEK